MTDHKFTDEEIIKTLKNAKYKVDGVVTRGFYLTPETFNAVVDLIGRQKAEIESLNAVYADMTESLRLAAEANKDMQAKIEKLGRDHYQILPDGRLELIPRTDINAIKAEAIKEFAERLKKKMYPYNGLDKRTYAINARAVEKAIEDLVKETMEENK